VSVHPFTTSFGSADVRITSRFSDKEWYQGLAGTIHEGGHAMYEQNLGSSGLEIDEFLSMGTHESQSLFWERHVGLSRPFWNYATPLLQKAFGEFSFSSEEVYGAVNAVTPSLIRVEADELTYPLHVILRYQLERDVVEGRLDVSDIPQRWKDSMKELLNVDVPNDTNGCLQDVHWSGLAIGYFPTYLIGSATAAQLAHYCRKDIPDFDEKVEGGEFAEIKEWLTSKIHRHGRRYKSLDELLQAQVGEPLNPKYFIQYLTDKYTELYKC
jgi:carboxypeptidase Taq